MAVLVFDDFNGANGTDIVDHAPDIDVVGGGWNSSSSNGSELNGSGSVKFAEVADDAWIDVATTDQIVTCSYNAGGSDNRFSVVMRADNVKPTDSSSTNYFFNIQSGKAPGSNNLNIFRRILSSSIIIASKEITLDGSTTYELECSVIGNQLEFKVDGVTELSVTNSEITTGDYAGFFHALYTNGDLRLFDFTVEDVSGTQEVAPAFVDSEEVFYTPTVVRLLNIVSPEFTPTQEEVYTPEIVPLGVVLSPNFVESEEQVYSPEVQSLLQLIQVEFTESDEQFYRASVVGGDAIVIPIRDRATWQRIAEYLKNFPLRGNNNEIIIKWLISEGYEGTINEAFDDYLRELGYSGGSFSDKFAEWRKEE